MKLTRSILFATAVLASVFFAAHSASRDAQRYWRSEQPELASGDGSIVCSRASYLAYRKIGSSAGALNMDFSPIPEKVADKQRVIDGLASALPSGDATQVFASYFPTGEIFRKQCDEKTCSLKEMEEPLRACLTRYWDDCVHSLVRYESQNYCLLEVAGGDE